MEHVKVAVIGGGPGGYEAAIRLNQYGIECAVFEQDRIGGVCLNWGCIPTKAMVKSAEIWSEIGEAESYGLAATRGELDFTKIITRKDNVVEQLVSGVEYLFTKRKIPVFKTHVTSLEKTDGTFTIMTDSEGELSCDYVIVATGSLPKDLPNLKIDETDILSSTGILKLDKFPASLAVIGGGVIGCEFASIFNALGSEVTVLEFLPSLVSTEDEEIAKRLQIFLKKSGIKIKTNSSVVSYHKSADKLRLKLADETELEVDKVLLSVGRAPNLSFECKPGLVLSKNGSVQIDKYMQTSIPGLYAIGDVTGKMQLAHTASKQGLMVVDHISSLLGQRAYDYEELIYENIPRCTFTNPEVSSCGLTEQQAREKYGEIRIGKFLFAANGKAIAGGNTNGFVKLVAKADDLELIGMHVIGPNAAELIAQGSILINLKIRATDIDKVVFAHPTLSEAIMEAAEDLRGLSIHKM